MVVVEVNTHLPRPILDNHTSMITLVLELFGTEEMKRDILPRLLRYMHLSFPYVCPSSHASRLPVIVVIPLRGSRRDSG
jgi:hypothetical protein